MKEQFLVTSPKKQNHACFTTISKDNSENDIQSVSKKMSFCGKTAVTTFKLIQNAKVGGVLENSGYLLQNGH